MEILLVSAKNLHIFEELDQLDSLQHPGQTGQTFFLDANDVMLSFSCLHPGILLNPNPAMLEALLLSANVVVT